MSKAELVHQALGAAAEGDWSRSGRLWREVLKLDPGNVQALYGLAVHAFRQGGLDDAAALLRQASALAPGDPQIPLAQSAIHRRRDQADAEWDAINRALSADPYSVHALLAKAEFLERKGRRGLAAAVYRDALKVVPLPWPDALSGRLQHAESQVARDSAALAQALRADVAGLRMALKEDEAARWDEAISIMAGQTRPYVQQCNQLHVPRLPPIPFYGPDRFPWIEAFQARTDAIRGELQALMIESPEEFSPYIAYRPGEPVNQWQSLNHSRAWSSFHLWRHGEPVSENIRRCPETAAALALVDSAHIGGLCPNAMFSALAPGTRIPPHTGETNARLVAHLPLIVPDGCTFRVGAEWRQWEVGKVMVFDDTIEHEARNDSDAVRVVVIFDVWNPLLSSAERGMVNTVSAGVREFRRRADG